MGVSSFHHKYTLSNNVYLCHIVLIPCKKHQKPARLATSLSVRYLFYDKISLISNICSLSICSLCTEGILNINDI